MEVSTGMALLPRASALASPGSRQNWHPQAEPAHFSEIFSAASDPGGTGACIALVEEALRQREAEVVDRRPLLWVQDERAIKLSGRPYRPGLPAELRHRVIHVAAKSAQDALFALEEGLRCRDLACVVGEIAGNPKQFDFTASRRLALAAEKHGSLLFLLRHDARADLSAARMRWRVRSATSVFPLWGRDAPGPHAWHAELFRARAHPPGQWTLRDDEFALAAQPAANSPDTSTPDHGDLVLCAGS